MGLQTRVPRLLPCEMSRQARLLVCVFRVYWRLDEESASADREADAPTSLDIWYRSLAKPLHAGWRSFVFSDVRDSVLQPQTVTTMIPNVK